MPEPKKIPIGQLRAAVRLLKWKEHKTRPQRRAEIQNILRRDVYARNRRIMVERYEQDASTLPEGDLGKMVLAIRIIKQEGRNAEGLTAGYVDVLRQKHAGTISPTFASNLI